jgi:hypothetical protein
MGEHTRSLWQLARKILDPHQLTRLQTIASKPFDYSELARFDRSLGDPNLTTIQTKTANGFMGQYALADAEVFRPLQYCAVYFEFAAVKHDLEWRTRDIVQMSGLHLESLVARIGEVRGLPLGRALRSRFAKLRIDPDSWQRVRQFTEIYNASKHQVDQPKDTHLFSVTDAILAYIVCRQLAMKLYPLATMKTNWRAYGK